MEPTELMDTAAGCNVVNPKSSAAKDRLATAFYLLQIAALMFMLLLFWGYLRIALSPPSTNPLLPSYTNHYIASCYFEQNVIRCAIITLTMILSIVFRLFRQRTIAVATLAVGIITVALASFFQ